MRTLVSVLEFLVPVLTVAYHASQAVKRVSRNHLFAFVELHGRCSCSLTQRLLNPQETNPQHCRTVRRLVRLCSLSDSCRHVGLELDQSQSAEAVLTATALLEVRSVQVTIEMLVTSRVFPLRGPVPLFCRQGKMDSKGSLSPGPAHGTAVQTSPTRASVPFDDRRHHTEVVGRSQAGCGAIGDC